MQKIVPQMAIQNFDQNLPQNDKLMQTQFITNNLQQNPAEGISNSVGQQ